MKSLYLISLLVPLAFAASIFDFSRETAANLLPQFLLTNEVKTSSQHELISLHKSLVEIESITGNEYQVGQFLKTYLKQKGFNVYAQEVQPKRYNIYAYKGDSLDAKVLLTSHMDTVPPYFPYYTKDEDIYGRGSNDAKASVATQIIAAVELYERKVVKDGDLALLFVVGEEVDGAGMKFASKNLDANWEKVIFGEPTELKLGIGHKGIYNFNIKVKGKAAHSGYPYLGIDANRKLLEVLNNILAANLPADELLGNSTINPGLIQAGVASNVVSPKAEAKVLIRVAHNTVKVKSIIEKIAQEANEEYHNVEIEDVQNKEPVYLDYDYDGFEKVVLAYFTDVSHLEKPVQKKYLYGPGSVTAAHTVDEHVSISDLTEATAGYKKFVAHLLVDN